MMKRTKIITLDALGDAIAKVFPMAIVERRSFQLRIKSEHHVWSVMDDEGELPNKFVLVCIKPNDLVLEHLNAVDVLQEIASLMPEVSSGTVAEMILRKPGSM